MKMKYIIIPILLLFGLNSCDTAWDNYFDENKQNEGIGSGLNLLEYLETQESYSKFTSLIKKSGVDSVLMREQVLTIWAIPDELIPVDMEDPATGREDIKRFILNHINNVALYKSKLTGTRKIHTLAGKLLNTSYIENIFSIDNVGVTRMNQICNNGVVHELKGVLFPKQNVYEYFLGLGEEFSIFKDTLARYNDTVFRADLSLPVGENEFGNIVYDSVFVIENEFLAMRDPRNEEIELTMFIPTNDAVKRMFLTVTNFFNTIGREFTAKDTNDVMKWLMRSSIHSGRISNYAGVVSRYSVFNTHWRTDKQYVKEDYESCSNGNAYIVTTLVFPKINYMETVEIRPYYVFQMSQEDQQKYLQVSPEVKRVYPTVMQEPHEILFAELIEESSNGAWIQFSSVIRDMFGMIRETKIMPGKYKLCASFRAYACPNLDLYVIYEEDGQEKSDFILKFNAGQGATGNAKPEQKRGKYEYVPVQDAGMKNRPNDSNGLVVENFEVKAEWGFSSLKFKMICKDNKKTRISPQYLMLIPTEDNY